MTDKILDTTKEALGIAVEYDAFDSQIIMHINSVLGTLHQLGIGPSEGFEVVDGTEEWGAFLQSSARLESVKTYMYLKVRLYFDPPSTSFHISAMQDQIRELEYRLNTAREEQLWVSQHPPAELQP